MAPTSGKGYRMGLGAAGSLASHAECGPEESGVRGQESGYWHAEASARGPGFWLPTPAS
jgi:hypothetical protein